MLKRWLMAAICAAMVISQAGICLAADDIDISPSPYYREQTQQQKENQQVDITGSLRHSGFGDGGWDIETSTHQIFQIQNSQPWADEPWFKPGANVRITGNLRPDIRQADANKSTLVAEHIYQVKTSAVKNTDNSIPGQIESQIKKQVNQENVTNYAKKVPFMKKWLNKIGL